MSTPDFTDKAATSIQAAIQLAKDYAHPHVQPVHLALALYNEGGSATQSSRPGTPTTAGASGDSLFKSCLSKAGVDTKKFEDALRAALKKTPQQNPPPDDMSLSSAAAKILKKADSLKEQQHDSFVAVDHLLLALIEDSSIETILKNAGLANTRLLNTAITQSRGNKRIDSKQAEAGYEALAKYCTDLTALAEQGKIDPVIGRDEVVRRVIRCLSRRTKNNCALIGEPGVGKTAVAELLAQRIVDRDIPDSLQGRLLALDMGALMAGAKYRGEYEERIKSVINEIEQAAQSGEVIILFIDEMHLIAKGGGDSGMDAANLIKPALARGLLRVIGATTLNEYRQLEKDAAFERRFQVVQVNEPTVEQCIAILRGIKEKYENHHGVRITDSAVVAAAKMAKRYLTSRRLPDAAIDLIDEAASDCKVTQLTLPPHIDDLQRRKVELQVAIHALEREAKKDPNAKESLESTRKELSSVEEALAPAMAEWEAKRAKGDELNALRRKVDELRAKADTAERRGDLATSSDLRYYAIPGAMERIAALEAEEKRKAESGEDDEGTVGPEQVAKIVSRATGISVGRLQEGEKDKLLKLERNLSKEVAGQKEAVSAVSNAIRLSRSGLADPNKPVSFLFAGPSGTGKTFLCKQLAKQLFDDESAMVRIDASEYSERHAVARLIGAPPGYVGYEQGGVLTEAVRRKPFSVILVDELEKAAREFVQLFLQVLDDGRLTDSTGRVVNFRDCIIIFTSNLGAQYINDSSSEQLDTETKALVQGALNAALPPEFRNRLSASIIFHKLTRADIKSIVDQRIKEVQGRLRANGRRIQIDVDDAAKDYLAERGYDPAMGARPLQRVIQNEVLSPMSVLILRGAIRDQETVKVRYDAASNKIVVLPNHEVEVADDDIEMEDSDIESMEEEPLD